MRSALLCISVALGISLMLALPAAAQAPTRTEIDAAVDARLRSQWAALLAEAARDFALTVDAGRLAGPRDAKVSAYTRALDLLMADDELLALFTPVYIRSLIDERVGSRTPASFNAASTNPATAGLPESSGSTSLAALAADLAAVASADKSAVSINVSGLAFISLRDPETYTELANYQRHALARRFSGTFVFGAKIPEKEITGLSSLPEFETLFDAFGWDVKVRILGDKDPRSARWSPLTVRAGGLITQKAAVVLSLIGTTPRPGETAVEALEDAAIVQALLNERVGEAVSAIKARIARSPQLSVKLAGTHLTKAAGNNKYSVTALFDVGAGPADLTLNVQYAVTDDIRFGVNRLFQTKVWTIGGEVVTHLAPDAIVRGRTIDWGVGTSVALFHDRASLPVMADHTFKVFTRLELPIRGGGRIPFSVIYSNDPNALTKRQFVSGQIGISYDFSALGQLFASGS